MLVWMLIFVCSGVSLCSSSLSFKPSHSVPAGLCADLNYAKPTVDHLVSLSGCSATGLCACKQESMKSVYSDSVLKNRSTFRFTECLNSP